MEELKIGGYPLEKILVLNNKKRSTTTSSSSTAASTGGSETPLPSTPEVVFSSVPEETTRATVDQIEMDQSPMGPDHLKRSVEGTMIYQRKQWWAQQW
jgi:hypothetical protein